MAASTKMLHALSAHMAAFARTHVNTPKSDPSADSPPDFATTEKMDLPPSLAEQRDGPKRSLAELRYQLELEKKVEHISGLFASSQNSKHTVLSADQTIKELVDKFPRIWMMIVQLWGTRELHVKLQQMLYLDTDGRKGFPFDILTVLVRLYDIHSERFGFEGGLHEHAGRLTVPGDLSAGTTGAIIEKKRDRW